MEGSTYVTCPGTTMRISGLRTYNIACSNDVLGTITTPSLFFWTYDSNGNKLAMTHNSYGFASDVNRADVIGPSSSISGINLSSSSPSTNNIYTFNNVGAYTIYIDLMNSFCDDATGKYACPWLGGSWRSPICSNTLVSTHHIYTLAQAEGWINVTNYNIFVPSKSISLPNLSDVRGATSYNVSFKITNNGIGKESIRIYRNCTWWSCSFIGYTEGREIILNEGQVYIIGLNANIDNIDPLATPTDRFGITVAYDDGYGLSCISPAIAYGSVKALCFAKGCKCNPDSCICSTGSVSCCMTIDSCVWNNACYANNASADIDSDGEIEDCLNGTWFAKPVIQNISTDRSIVDRNKETLETRDDLNFNVSIYDQDISDRGKVYITLTEPSGGKEVNLAEMSCSDIDIHHWRCSYHYNPRNDAPVGDYNVTITAVDKQDYSAQKILPNFFKVEDISMNISWFGNTTDMYFTGKATYLSNGEGIRNLSNQTCSQPKLPPGQDSSPENLRMCGVNAFQPSTCTINGDDYNCYIQDVKITNKTAIFSYIITDSNGISGSADVAFLLNGTINYVWIDDLDGYVNPYQNITYFLNFTPAGDMGWWGRIYNQTRIGVYSESDNLEYLSYNESQSFINLLSNQSAQLFYIGHSKENLGIYNLTVDARYFWPEYYNSYGFKMFNYSIANKTISYNVATIDITHHKIDGYVSRGQMLTGELGGYFVASKDISYWEVTQAFTYRVTNKTTSGIYWVNKVNLSSGLVLTEITPKNMSWNGINNNYEANINTFDLNCDNNETTHRIYYLINWTSYNIYTPYVDGKFDPKYYPYYYQDFKVLCAGREFFEVNPSIVNVPLGTTDKDIASINVVNPRNESLNADILIVSKTNDGFSNWMDFRTDTGDCQEYSDNFEGCRNTNLGVGPTTNSSSPGENSTVLHITQAPRLGSYAFDVILRNHDSGEEMGRKAIMINVFSDAVGSDQVFGLVLVFLAVMAILASQRKVIG